MLMPILVFLFGIAYPLGWFAPPTHEQMAGVLGNPLVALVLFVLCYGVVFAAGIYYINRLIAKGPRATAKDTGVFSANPIAAAKSGDI